MGDSGERRREWEEVGGSGWEWKTEEGSRNKGRDC